MKKEQIITQLKELIEEQTEKRINNNDEDINIDSFTMMLVITFADQKLNIKHNNINNINKPINVEINTALLGIYTFTQGKV